MNHLRKQLKMTLEDGKTSHVCGLEEFTFGKQLHYPKVIYRLDGMSYRVSVKFFTTGDKTT